MIQVSWATGERRIPDAAVRRAARAALEHGGRPGIALSVVFVSDAELARMHARHLDDPRPTDVITFDLGEETGGPAGELYVSAERAAAESARRGSGLERELLLYVVHGCLHLCGLDDQTPGPRARMRAAEARVLAALGLDRPRRGSRRRGAGT
jgi:probable rRNA maturation factor